MWERETLAECCRHSYSDLYLPTFMSLYYILPNIHYVGELAVSIRVAHRYRKVHHNFFSVSTWDRYFMMHELASSPSKTDVGTQCRRGELHTRNRPSSPFHPLIYTAKNRTKEEEEEEEEGLRYQLCLGAGSIEEGRVKRERKGKGDVCVWGSFLPSLPPFFFSFPSSPPVLRLV